MSRAINLPSQSVKLTNVAIVRLTLAGKRFEIACYKNKVLDYRNGLETDLSEVLQTSNIHIFTNVTKGQFASSTDCITAFGPIKGKNQDDMAIHILLHGKSIQISEIERQQLYDTTLLQIATHIATTCIHPYTGVPYTTSQIKQALTTTTTTTTTNTTNASASTTKITPSNFTSDHTTKKKNNKSSKKSSTTAVSSSTSTNHNTTTSTESQQYQQHFVIQPHKPIKQQYLQAIKYLQSNHIIPIIRASMELIWYYPIQHDSVVQDLLQTLHINTNTTNTTESIDGNHSTSTTTTNTMNGKTSTYRPNHLLQSSDLPPPSKNTLVEPDMSVLTINDDDKDDTTTSNIITPTTLKEKSVDSTTTNKELIMMSRSMIVDPSMYRILQEYTYMMDESNIKNENNKQQYVPNSRIEIVRQQVFQKPSLQSTTTLTSTTPLELDSSTLDTPLQKPISSTIDADNDHDHDDSDDDVDNDSESNNGRAHVTQWNQNQLQQLLLHDDDDDSDDSTSDKNNQDDEAENNTKVDHDDDYNIIEDESEDDDYDAPERSSRGRNAKIGSKKKKKKHLQLVQSQMAEKAVESSTGSTTLQTITIPVKSKGGKKSKKNSKPDHYDDEGPQRNDDVVATTPSSNTNDSRNNNIITSDPTTNAATTTTTTTTALFTCNTCIGIENAFTTNAEYRAHYRSDWHRYNQKLKSCSSTPISYNEFMMCDAQSFFNMNDDF